jgi:hypothetical protein
MKAGPFDPLNFTPHDIVIRLGTGKEITFPSVGVCRAEPGPERCAFTCQHGDEFETHAPGWASTGVGYDATGEERAQAGYGCIVVLQRPSYGGITWSPGPPGEKADVIVSIVAAPLVAVDRPDVRVFVPDTGPKSAIRGPDGRIVAIRRLILWEDPYAATHRLRVIILVNPVNEGDGCYVMGRYLPTREGIEEALADRQVGDLELVDERGTSRASDALSLTGTADDDVDELWKWLQDRLER